MICNVICIYMNSLVIRLQFPHINGTGVLFVPFARTLTRQTRSFSLVGPSVWNGLPLTLRLLPGVGLRPQPCAQSRNRLSGTVPLYQLLHNLDIFGQLTEDQNDLFSSLEIG